MTRNSSFLLPESTGVTADTLKYNPLNLGWIGDVCILDVSIYLSINLQSPLKVLEQPNKFY